MQVSDKGRKGDGKDAARREYEVDCRGRGWRSWFLLCILLCILLSPPSTLSVTQSSSSLLKLELTPEVLMHLSTPHTVHKDTYVVCWMSGQENRGLGKWNEITACRTSRRRADTTRWRTAKEAKKRDEVTERECSERNGINCILNSKHRPHYEKISTFRMHNPREKDENPAEVERGCDESSGSWFLYGYGLPTVWLLQTLSNIPRCYHWMHYIIHSYRFSLHYIYAEHKKIRNIHIIFSYIWVLYIIMWWTYMYNIYIAILKIFKIIS